MMFALRLREQRRLLRHAPIAWTDALLLPQLHRHAKGALLHHNSINFEPYPCYLPDSCILALGP